MDSLLRMSQIYCIPISQANASLWGLKLDFGIHILRKRW